MLGQAGSWRRLLLAGLLLILVGAALLLPHLRAWGQPAQPEIPERWWYSEGNLQPGQPDVLRRLAELEKKLDKLLKEMESLRQELHQRPSVPPIHPPAPMPLPPTLPPPPPNYLLPPAPHNPDLPLPLPPSPPPRRDGPPR